MIWRHMLMPTLEGFMKIQYHTAEGILKELMKENPESSGDLIHILKEAQRPLMYLMIYHLIVIHKK